VAIILNLLNKRAALMLENIFIAIVDAWNSLPNAVFAASSAKNFKMNLCKVNFDRFLTIVE